MNKRPDTKMSDVLTIEKQAACWTFVLNRPAKMNALSSDLIEALIAGVTRAHQEDIPLLVFTGEGKNFSAGFDFTDYEAQSEGDLVLRFVRIEMLLNLVATSPSLTLALAHGKNFGAGVDLFAVCKQRFCTADTRFRMPGLKFGLVLGTQRFQEIVGTHNAMAILGDTKTFSAEEALSMGFIHDIVDRDQWSEKINAAQKLAQGLDPATRARFYGVLDKNRANDNMAALVYSAARPGLKDRIKGYLSI